MGKIIKYGIIGSSGRLGNEVAHAFSEAGHELVFGYDVNGTSGDGTPELLVDCSLPEVFPKTLEYAAEFGAPLIIATTGLTEQNFSAIREISGKIPVVQSYNFSIGIQVLLKLTGVANDILPGWDVEIEETHHRFKKDKPSGTAKMIQEIFGGREINTSSLRLGNVAGEHVVKLGGPGEVLSIGHSATSRRTFAEGILLSAQFIIGKKPGLYSFSDVVFRK